MTSTRFFMEQKEKISIIIPAYKASPYIKECLDSIQGQTYFSDNGNYEILLGIDGCAETLETVEKIRSQYKNLKVFVMESNKGVYITLNTLLSLVSAENVIIFNADDVMKPLMVEEIARYIKGYEIVRFYCERFNDKTGQVTDIMLPHGSLYFNKTVSEKLGGFKAWVCAADTDFVNRAVSIFTEKRILEVLFRYRVHGGSLTQKPGTGIHSDLRNQYIKQISNNFEYVDPEVNTFFEVK